MAWRSKIDSVDKVDELRHSLSFRFATSTMIPQAIKLFDRLRIANRNLGKEFCHSLLGLAGVQFKIYTPTTHCRNDTAID